ncbi:hypothetical protein [Sporosarcina sp. FSL K6-3457]|uniref:hypothetical protein n=1 Tax=Sporosarcina sp. FSL K6-3457 TaxID=2978204 RepID=UPI0030F82E24
MRRQGGESMESVSAVDTAEPYETEIRKDNIIQDQQSKIDQLKAERETTKIKNLVEVG